GGEIPDPHDALRSALLIHEIEVICGDQRIRGIKEMLSGIKRQGAAGNGGSIDLERTSFQVDGIRSGRIQVRIDAANAGSGVSHPQVAFWNARCFVFYAKKQSGGLIDRIYRTDAV